ncbi:butyrophilin subfamily 1 member A1 isoform X2 [Cuculus canorus]|uniref:butyrophilin subfamily 1 member A1 isoform X2 n=1 Tax=Cuculus canorus TaxID=55661 RepID=UPI0023AA9551|nr:butyrophilin subfamily 1 member A1 isoform X2 [Cuculus canorus]
MVPSGLTMVSSSVIAKSNPRCNDSSQMRQRNCGVSWKVFLFQLIWVIFIGKKSPNRSGVELSFVVPKTTFLGVKLCEKMLVSSCSHLPRVSSVLACVLIFFFGFHVHELDCALFKVLGPDHPITTVVGEDVILPCHLSPGLNAEKMEVRWFRSHFSIYVHLYHSGQDHYSSQMPEYQERTELLKEGISVGNVSLRILRTRLSDEGQYQCLVRDGNFYEEATVELKATVSGSSPVLSVEDYQDGGIRVGCRAAGWYPKPEILWLDAQGHQLPSLTIADSQDQDGLFEVKKSIIIQRNANRNLSCSIRNTQLPQEKDATINISAVIFPRGSPWMVALFATLAACVASLASFALLAVRLREKRDAEICERDKEIEKHAAELRWRNTIVPVEEVHVTLDEDTAHPQLILSAGGKRIRRGDTRQAMPDNPERYDTYHCVLGQEVFFSGRHFWEVDVGTEEGGVWAMGVAKESMKRKGWINPAPQDGILALFFCGGKYWALTSPDHTALHLTQNPRLIRIYLDFEEQKVAFFNADNQDLLFTFPLAPLSGEKIRPWFRVGPIAQLCLKSPPQPPRVPSVEEALLGSCYPCRASLWATRPHKHQMAGHDQDWDIHGATHKQP